MSKVSFEALPSNGKDTWHTVVLQDGHVQAGFGRPGSPTAYDDQGKVRRVWELVEPVIRGFKAGRYHFEDNWTYTLTIERGRERWVYVLARDTAQPEAPASLRELWGALSGMFKW